MRSIGFFILVFGFTLEAIGVSAHRFPDEDYQQAAAKALFVYGAETHFFQVFDEETPEGRLSATPFQEKQVFSKLKLDKIPSLAGEKSTLIEAFNFIRDLRFLEHNETRRRSSWMYPDDGCWVRAELAKQNLVDLNPQEISPVKKLFIFGNLKVKTSYSPNGEVNWWYHVAPVVRHQGEAYVLDPALNHRGPLKVTDWILLQVDKLEDAELAICEADTFHPAAKCQLPKRYARAGVERRQVSFLDSESHRLESLGFDVEAYLGDFPPWAEAAPLPFALKLSN